ncbi:MAG: hypothetical protein RLZZ324_1040 [Candidatus Parcubacteria bacterium]|jgi:hypothetical protein
MSNIPQRTRQKALMGRTIFVFLPKNDEASFTRTIAGVDYDRKSKRLILTFNTPFIMETSDGRGGINSFGSMTVQLDDSDGTGTLYLSERNGLILNAEYEIT